MYEAQDLDLTLTPDKCVSIVFDSKKMDHMTTFSLANASTHNIAEVLTRNIGKVFAGSYSLTKQVLAAKLESNITSSMQH